MIHVLYHKNCRDGFGAAWAAWTHLRHQTAAMNYIPVAYNEPVPDVFAQDDEVYIVDFSYPAEVLLELQPKVKTLLVLDHHKTAADELEGLPFAIFDMHKSGAVLSWEYFHGNDPIPVLLRYVQDNDLWKHEMPMCKEIIRYIDSCTQDFIVWGDLAEQMEHNFTLVKADAYAMSQWFNSHVRRKVQEAQMIEFEGYSVPIVSTDKIFSSEVCAAMHKHFRSPFAMSFTFDKSIVEVSLRSAGEVDVAAIAKKYMGGGHTKAAGFRCQISVLHALLTQVE